MDDFNPDPSKFATAMMWWIEDHWPGIVLALAIIAFVGYLIFG